MKAKFTLLAILAIAFFSAQAQTIPNNGFDTWTSPLNPNGWATYASAFGFNFGLCAKDSLDKVVGPNSVRVYSDSVPGQPAYGVVAGLVSTGTGSATGGGPSFAGTPFAFRPDTIFFAYKFVSPAVDTARMIITMTKNGAGVFTGGASTVGLYLDTLSQWGLVYVPITSLYSNGTITPDTLLLQFRSGNKKKTIGSILHVDEVFFSASAQPNGVNEIANNIEVSVFPNPASNQLNITSTANLEGHKVVVTDMNGKLVCIRPLGNNTTSIDLTDVASGTYIYRIADKAGRFVKQDRFAVVK